MRFSRQELEVRDRALLTRIRCGDHEALRELYYAYFPYLLKFTEKQLRVKSDAPDVVHDVFLSLWQRRGVIEIKDNVYSYLFAAVRMRSRDTRNRQIQIAQNELESDPHTQVMVPQSAIVGPDGERDARAKELGIRVEQVLCKMSIGMQEFFRLSRLHQFSHAEIAEASNVTLNTVNVQITRAIRLISADLAKNPI